MKIELIFKTMKDFENLLPVKKWDADRVKGKILMDVIELIAGHFFREALSVVGLEIPSILVQLQSLECYKIDTDMVNVYTAKTNVREMYEKVGKRSTEHPLFPLKGHAILCACAGGRASCGSPVLKAAECGIKKDGSGS